MSDILDCRGLTCPEPVVRSKRHIAQNRPLSLEVVVDNQAALENVSRLLKSQGYRVAAEKRGPDWHIAGSRPEDGSLRPEGAPGAASEAGPEAGAEREKVCVLIASDVFGSGDDELGAKLMKNFLATLPEFGESLWLLILLNGGVKLAAKGSAVLDQLKAIREEGTGILVCGTCLEHFGLLQDKVVGETTNMLDVVTSLQYADKVIKI